MEGTSWFVVDLNKVNCIEEMCPKQDCHDPCRKQLSGKPALSKTERREAFR